MGDDRVEVADQQQPAPPCRAGARAGRRVAGGRALHPLGSASGGRKRRRRHGLLGAGHVPRRCRDAYEGLQLALGHDATRSAVLDHGIVFTKWKLVIRIPVFRYSRWASSRLASTPESRCTRRSPGGRPPRRTTPAAPCRSRGGAVGMGGQVVDVDDVAPGQVVQLPEARHREAAITVEGADDPVALGALDLVHAPDELRLVSWWVRSARIASKACAVSPGPISLSVLAAGTGLSRVRADGQSFRNDGMSMSSSGIWSDARWRSSM